MLAGNRVRNECFKMWRLTYLLCTKLFLLQFFLNSNDGLHRYSNKRQFIGNAGNAVHITRWSGPYFNDNDQKSAFKELVDGRVPESTKRMELEGIDPNGILNPLPIIQKKKEIKDDGPIGEAYIGQNPYPEKVDGSSPQERLAGFISTPIEEEYQPPHPTAARKSEPTEQFTHRHGNYPQNSGYDQKPDSNPIEEQKFSTDKNSDDAEKSKELVTMFQGNEKAESNFKHAHDFEHGSHFMREKNNEEDENSLHKPTGERSRFIHKASSRNGMFLHGSEDESNDFTNKPHLNNFEQNQDRDYSSHEKRIENYGNENAFHHHRNFDNNNNNNNGEEKEDAFVSQDDSYNHLETHGEPDRFNGKSGNDGSTEKMLSLFDTHDHNEYESSMKYDHEDALNNNEHNEDRGTKDEDDNNAKKRSDINRTGNRKLNSTSFKKHAKVKRSKQRHLLQHFMGTANLPAISPHQLPSFELGKVGEIQSPEESVADSGTSDVNNVADTLLKDKAVFHVADNEETKQHSKEQLDDETIYLHHHRDASNKLNEENKSMNKLTSKHKNLSKRMHQKKSKIKKSLLLKNKKKPSIVFPSYKRNQIKPSPMTSNNKIGSKRWGESFGGAMIRQNSFLEDNTPEAFRNFNIMGGTGHEVEEAPSPNSGMYNGMVPSPNSGMYNGMAVATSPDVPEETQTQQAYPSTVSNTEEYMEAAPAPSREPVGQVGGAQEVVNVPATHTAFDDVAHNPLARVPVDPLHSLSASDAHTDHETAGIIDAIWEHDYENHGNRNRHRNKDGMLGFFGHTDQNALLPAETLDGIAEHWEHDGHRQGNTGATLIHNAEGEHEKIGPLQEIQDDPAMDTELPAMGVGMPINNGLHNHHGGHSHSHHGHLGIGVPYVENHRVNHGGANGMSANIMAEYEMNGHHATPTLPESSQGAGITPDQYHKHLDFLLQKFHQLEVDMKGQHGPGLIDQIDQNLLNHPTPPHSPYNVYATKNPWDNARLPYHVPVENHPDNSNPAVGGLFEEGDKGAEKGGPLTEPKIEAKPESEPKTEAKPDIMPSTEAKPDSEPKTEAKPDSEPKTEAKPDSEPKTEAKPELKPKENKEPKKHGVDWTGTLPKIPAQRGGPEESGSVGLTSNNTLISEAIQKHLKKGDPASIKQAISVYKSLNMSVPANLQIEELKEELKEAQEKAKSVTAKSPAGSTSTQENPALPSKAFHETAAAKNKEPRKVSGEVAEKTSQSVMNEGEKNNALLQINSVNSSNASDVRKLQQLKLIKQAFLNQMLASAIKQDANKPDEAQNDKENTSEASVEKEKEDANSTPQEKDKETLVQQTKLLALLKQAQKENKLQLAGGVTSNLGLTALHADSNPTATETSESTEVGTQSPILNTVLSKLMEAKEKQNNLSNNTASVQTTADNNDAPSLELPEDETSTNSQLNEKKQESNDLVNILNTSSLSKKHKHHKKKSHKVLESPYAKIGYEQADDLKGASKKDTSSSKGETGRTTIAIENVSDTKRKSSPIESSLEYDEEEETSKKNKIKTKSKHKI